MKDFFNLDCRFAIIALLLTWLAFLENTEGAEADGYGADVTATTGIESSSCNQNHYNCSSGSEQCIPLQFVCDGDSDCDDTSDENGFMCHQCSKHFLFHCTSGQCISSDWRCDGYPDCGDGSDEVSCPITDIHIALTYGHQQRHKIKI